MKTQIYKTTIKSPYSSKVLIYYVNSNIDCAREDLYTAIQQDTGMPPGQARIKAVSRSTRKALKNADAVKNCNGWAWVKPI